MQYNAPRKKKEKKQNRKCFFSLQKTDTILLKIKQKAQCKVLFLVLYLKFQFDNFN